MLGNKVIGPHSPLRMIPETQIIVNATAVNREHSRQRWLRDEGLLEAELAKDPNGDTRSAFYLAQTYGLIGKPLKAYYMNIRRYEMGGWMQERYMALVRAGEEIIRYNNSIELASRAWLRAYELDPTRAEALYELANWYRLNGQNHLCAVYGLMATKIPYPSPDTLFIDGETYDWRRWDVLSICAWVSVAYANAGPNPIVLSQVAVSS